ncbi:DMT family transporter [Alkalihalobacterium chitinilyticum]|uniref:DMT family transporter n=1 Tax=Alkalihalobacterium chitinilyticum TaxID=2980103 RepID=A0ABT5VH32_9BACI|nr:DMT family transporter [Alkalihalobacterium chitinilyticum]MDE5414744.1 DMT family transporter [Alkalihalobacterium chitinilyticum]
MKAYLLIIIAILFFSGNFIVGKLMVGNIPSFTLSFLRCSLAFLIMVFIARTDWKIRREVLIRNWKPIYALSLTGIVIFIGLVYYSLNFTTTINASIVEASTPIFAAILGLFLLKERLLAVQYAGIIISSVGVLWIVTNGSIEQLLGLQLNVGDLLMVVAVLAWCIYSILVTKYMGGLPTRGTLMVMLGMACLTLLPFVIMEWILLDIMIVWNAPTILSVLYLGIFPSIIAIICWNKGVEQIGASKAAVFLNLIPVFTTIQAVLILDERIYIEQLFGGLLVIVGVLLTTKLRSVVKVNEPLKLGN